MVEDRNLWLQPCKGGTSNTMECRSKLERNQTVQASGAWNQLHCLKGYGCRILWIRCPTICDRSVGYASFRNSERKKWEYFLDQQKGSVYQGAEPTFDQKLGWV